MAYPNYGGGYGAPPGPPPPHHGGGYGGYGAPPGPPPPQGGGYGAPPGGYGAPPGGYGAPPGAPPAGYGAPPPPGPPAGYGAPPPPPPHHHHHHHHGGGQMLYLDTPIPPPPPAPPAQPPPGYNVYHDVERIRKACKGFGTDEKALIDTLAPLDAFQINALNAAFVSTTGKQLIAQLEGETSGWFEAALRAKVLGPVGYDVWLIHRACDGAGTHEDILNEVLLMRTNQEMHLLKEAYRAAYNKRLEDVVAGDLSLKTKRLFTMALQGARMDDHAPVDHNMVQHDVKELKSAARGAGTDEIKICGILTSRSTPHLQAVSQAYGSSLSKMVSSEFSGHMKDALLYITDSLTSSPPGIARDAALLEDSMKGMGTKDERLIYRLFRAHWNRQRFELVKRIYKDTQSKRGLKKRIDGETSGDYKKFLLAVVGSD